MLKLYDYYRSSASFRVRIALNLKGLEYQQISVDLLKGEQQQAEYRQVNPQGFVPMLDTGSARITQSIAIIDHLDALEPDPRLIPEEPAARAQALALALTVAADIHPLNNLRVLKYLSGTLGQDEAGRTAWMGHWMQQGFEALQALAEPTAGRFLVGDTPSLADACLIPQLFNARRFGIDLEPFPLLLSVEEEAMAMAAFESAHPDRVAPTP